MTSSYKIGLTQGGMAALDTLIDSDPFPMPAHYPEYVRAGDGLTYGVGDLQAEWRWKVIDVTDIAALRAYCPDVSAAVFIQTPNTDGAFDQFSAVLEWPQTPKAFIGEFFEDFALRFSKLIKVGGST